MSLITGIKGPKSTNPKTFILFSRPKSGKTELITKLPDHLIIDFEGGTDYFTANAVKIVKEKPEDTSLTLLKRYSDLKKELAAGNYHFKFICIDTISSALLHLANAIAVYKYNKENDENEDLDWDITTLAYGVGHTHIRNAIQAIIESFKPYADYIIINAHVADKSVTKKSKTIEIKDLDLPGKLKNILTLKVDTIGLLHRHESIENLNMISFVHESDGSTGSRSPHLRNRELQISLLKDNKLYTNWHEIYVDYFSEDEKVQMSPFEPIAEPE